MRVSGMTNRVYRRLNPRVGFAFKIITLHDYACFVIEYHKHHLNIYNINKIKEIKAIKEKSNGSSK